MNTNRQIKRISEIVITVFDISNNNKSYLYLFLVSRALGVAISLLNEDNLIENK